MIASCGLTTRVPDARSRAGLAGAARPLRRRQGRRDPDAAPRDRRAPPHQPPPEDVVARPRRAQRAEPTAAHPTAPAAAGDAPNAAALARPARCPTLDLPARTTRPTHRTADPGPGTTDGPRESPLGLPTDSERVGRTRPSRRRLDRLDDPEGRRDSIPRHDKPVRRWSQFLRAQDLPERGDRHEPARRARAGERGAGRAGRRDARGPGHRGPRPDGRRLRGPERAAAKSSSG